MTDRKDFSGTPWGTVPSNADMALARLEQARAFLKAHSPDAAIREAEAALSLGAAEVVTYGALDVLADAHWLKDDPIETLEIGERMVGIDPHNVYGYIQVARAALAIRHFPKAQFAIDAGLREHPEHVGLLVLLSERHMLVGHDAGALPLARRAVELLPNSAYTLQHLAQVLIHAGKRKEAQAILKQVYELDPDAAATLSLAAHNAYAQHRHNEAIALATSALERDPEDRLSQQVLQRSKIYRNVLMRPYWLMARQNVGVVCLAVFAALSAMAWLGRSLAGGAIAAVFIYSMICLMISTWIERGRGPGDDKPKDVKLKDY